MSQFRGFAVSTLVSALLGLGGAAGAEGHARHRSHSAKPRVVAARPEAPPAPELVGDGFERGGSEGAGDMGVRKKQVKRPDWVETQTFEVERLSKSKIDDVVRAGLPDLIACHERFAGAHADAGSLTLALVIEPKGSVSSAEVTGAPSAKLGRCMSRVASAWQFPIADGETEIKYPLSFSSRGDSE